MAKNREMPSDQKAQLIMDAVEDRLAEDPVKIDLRGKTLIADFFLVATGTSEPHLKAITESVMEKADEENLPKPRVEGQAAAEWILMDFGDVVLHVMNAETRQRYKLEQFWTTPQPKGALPPTPDSVQGRNGVDEIQYGAMVDEEVDALDVDEDDEDEAAFFDDADQEVEPIDEEDIEFVESVRHKDTGEDDDDLPPAPSGNGSRA